MLKVGNWRALSYILKAYLNTWRLPDYVYLFVVEWFLLKLIILKMDIARHVNHMSLKKVSRENSVENKSDRYRKIKDGT